MVIMFSLTSTALLLGVLFLTDLHFSDAQKSRSKRYRKGRPDRDTTITVEMGIATDPLMTQHLNDTGKNTDQKKVDYILTHWNEVQLEWSRTQHLKRNVQIEIKYIHFMNAYPNNYKPTALLNDTLRELCKWQRGLNVDVDYFYFYTGLQDLDTDGRAYQSSACNSRKRCGIGRVSDIAISYLPTHEFGHSLGMLDSGSNPACLPPNDGIMGSSMYGWSKCSASQFQAFVVSRRGSCLSVTNVKTVSKLLVGRSLVSDYLGQLETEDEVCELENGPGFEFRPYPEKYSCGYHSCLNLNPGAQYGTMTKHVFTPRGGYCGEGKVCKFNNQCVPYSDIGITNYEVIAGGWSAWGEFSKCSRRCGTGVSYAKRTCTNPKPKNSPGCEGVAFKGQLCNTDPCPGDSADVSTLVGQRATETCQRLISNNIIDSTLFNGKGQKYSSNELGSCEVKCDPVSGHSPPRFFRYAIMPHGTPCDNDGTENNGDMDQGTISTKYHCVEGQCVNFGCNGTIGSVLDECLVCGGDGSTCTVIEDTIPAGQSYFWDYTYFRTIPAGAFNLRITTDQRLQPDVWFDIITTATWDVIIDGYNGGYFAYEKAPLPNRAGTDWYYYPKVQHIYVKKPLAEDVDFSVMQMSMKHNAATTVKYCLPA